MISSIRVGVGVLVCRNSLVLIGRRMGSHGAGTWSFPGGHVEAGEDPAITAVREVLEETGLVVENPKPLAFTSDVFEDQRHYITLFYTADSRHGSPVIAEPDRCSEWRWASYDNLPEPLFLPIVSLKKLSPLLDTR